MAARQAQRVDAYYEQHVENLYNIAMTEFELGHDDAAATQCQEGLSHYGERRFAYCALSVMAWSDELPAVPANAWAVVDSVRKRKWMTADSIDQIPMLEMLAAATILRAGDADSAARVLDRAAARPAVPGRRWIEAAIRYRLGQRERAGEILLVSMTGENPIGPMAIEGRALRALLRDTAIARVIRPRGD
jgi:hypothetical protein